MDELGSDPDIELTPKILVTTADDIPTVRRRTKPAPVVSGKKLKLPLLSFSGKPFDFGEKVVVSDNKSKASVPIGRREPETLPVNSSETRNVSCSGFYRTQYPASYTHKSLGRTLQFTLPASGTQMCLLCLSLKSQIPKLFRNDSGFPIFTGYL